MKEKEGMGFGAAVLCGSAFLCWLWHGVLLMWSSGVGNVFTGRLKAVECLKISIMHLHVGKDAWYLNCLRGEAMTCFCGHWATFFC
jgi:hypothetical protein